MLVRCWFLLMVLVTQRRIHHKSYIDCLLLDIYFYQLRRLALASALALMVMVLMVVALASALALLAVVVH
ncbi:hypothetical protein HZC21_05595 [Candidatus Peregrinibacteria bacterium]|nr:hypothetical protein [Candidatus Peregrinibacteria bacterium]